MLDASTKLIDENIRRDLSAVAQQNPRPADEVIEKTFQLRRLD
jgi:hypothetical protein